VSLPLLSIKHPRGPIGIEEALAPREDINRHWFVVSFSITSGVIATLHRFDNGRSISGGSEALDRFYREFIARSILFGIRFFEQNNGGPYSYTVKGLNEARGA
jgi:hypothetical protein